MRPHQFIAQIAKHRAQRHLHFLLLWPAFLIRAEAQIAAGDQKNLTLSDFARPLDSWKNVIHEVSISQKFAGHDTVQSELVPRARKQESAPDFEAGISAFWPLCCRIPIA
jgi:hypothetical protein